MNYDFLSASDGNGDAELMHVQADRLSGDPVIDVDITTNVPTKFLGTYGVLSANGLITPSSARNFRGHTSAGNLVIDAMEPGSTDDGNAEGDVVIIKPTTGWANRVAAFIKNAAGLGTPEALTVSTLTATSGTTLPAGDIGTADLAAGAVSYAKLLSTIFSGQVQTQVNAGSAGGTIWYLDLGGVKLAWGTTASISGAPNIAITHPTSFFSTIQTALAIPHGGYTSTNQMAVNVASSTATTLTLTPIIVAGSSPVNAYYWLVIGT